MNKTLTFLIFILMTVSTTACAQHNTLPGFFVDDNTTVYVNHRLRDNHVIFSYERRTGYHRGSRYHHYHHRHYYSPHHHYHPQKRVYYVKRHISQGPVDTYSRNVFFDRGWCVTQQITRINRHEIRVEEWRTQRGRGCF